jgi:hypothetical protein
MSSNDMSVRQRRKLRLLKLLQQQIAIFSFGAGARGPMRNGA